MRIILSRKISESAKNNKSTLLLTGDHGYALFDELRKTNPDQFINVGIMEQALISMSAGLAKVGFKPICYGLSAFVPTRVLEQIKFDVVLPQLPIKIIGDGAGLIYTTLGNSHFCAEDINTLSSLPHIEIYSPGDPEEMSICYDEFMQSKHPAYLRVGKSDNPKVNNSPLKNTDPYYTHKSDDAESCFVSTGAMLGLVHNCAKGHKVSHLSVMKIKPMAKEIVKELSQYKKLFIFEEHVRQGGLLSAITNLFVDAQVNLPVIESFCLNSSFTKKAGSYQYAMSEHNMSNEQIQSRLRDLL
jgi:transketolase